MNLTGMKRRENCLSHEKSLKANRGTHGDPWVTMKEVCERATVVRKALEYLDEISDILTEAYIDAASNEIKMSRQIKLLE